MISGLAAAALVLPIGPASARVQTDFTTMGQVGWPELGASVADRFHALPAAQQRSTVVIASSYWYAGALEHERAELGLPGIYSGNRGYGYLGVPPDATTALLVGDVAGADTVCATRTPLPPHVGPLPNQINDMVPMYLCTPRGPWSQWWPALREMT